MHIIDNLAELGTLLRETRKLQGLTQEQLAAICGVGPRFVRELENGKESCHIGKAMLVIKMLGLGIHVDGEPS